VAYASWFLAAGICRRITALMAANLGRRDGTGSGRRTVAPAEKHSVRRVSEGRLAQDPA